MKLLVIGSTGGTGQQVMEQALARGHSMTAVARRPEAITFVAPQLHVAQGDVSDVTRLSTLAEGHDAVISALGTRSGGATTLYSVGTTNILQAMHAAQIRRFITIAAGAYVQDAADPALIRFLIKPLLNIVLAGAYADMQRMEALIQKSNTDWTILRPARLTDGPRTGKYRVVVERAVPNGWMISRADIADYILTHLDEAQTFRTAVSIAY